jgi:hypothetical protein
VTTDPLATLRLFADMRQARLKLRGLDNPDERVRMRMIRRPEIYKALTVLFDAAEKLVAGPDEDALFWHPTREAHTEAEKRFDKLRRTMEDT